MKRHCSGSSINRNKGMVDHLKSYGVIKSKRVTEVMETIDRALFVPNGTRPYVDSPMSIGYNAHHLQCRKVGLLLVMLAILIKRTTSPLLPAITSSEEKVREPSPELSLLSLLFWLCLPVF
ncbi:hypothetical protein EV1_003185 [Malus domestica]